MFCVAIEGGLVFSILRIFDLSFVSIIFTLSNEPIYLLIEMKICIPRTPLSFVLLGTKQTTPIIIILLPNAVRCYSFCSYCLLIMAMDCIVFSFYTIDNTKVSASGYYQVSMS